MFLVLVVGLLFSSLWWRLIDVQLVRGEDFWQSVERNRWSELPIVPDRGAILDRFGQPLAHNQRQYLELDNPHQLYSGGRLIDQEEALVLMATQSASVRKQSLRLYPYGEVLAHTVGYLASITVADLAAEAGINPFGVVGKMGLEKSFERSLRGQLGRERHEVDAMVVRQRHTVTQPAQSGEDLMTALDPLLSTIAYKALLDQRGVVAISDVATGEILSLVSKPSFDPMIFGDLSPLNETSVRASANAKMQAWLTDEHRPFFHRVVSGQYPPGSVFKLVTALAGLETGAVDLTTTVRDEGVLRVGEFSYANWFYTQHGRTEGDIRLIRALARSNDIYFYKAAEWIGPNRLAEMSRLFGLGSPVGLEIGPEARGLVPDPAWKQAYMGEPWYLGNTYHFGIGQGDLQTTPLQLLQLTQAFGNHGVMCRPHLLDEGELFCQSLGVSEESLDAVLSGMVEACAPGGTSFPFFSRNGAILEQSSDDLEALSRGAVACKTGTAEFGGQDARGFRRTHGLWVGVVEPNYRIGRSDRGDRAETVDANQGNEELDGQEVRETESASTTAFDPLTASAAELYDRWAELASDHGYPKRLAILVIVESDDATPYKEGSRDAAPVAQEVLDWLEGNL